MRASTPKVIPAAQISEEAMALRPEPRKNRLLDALPDAEWQRWLPQLDAVEMPLGQVLYESGTTLR